MPDLLGQMWKEYALVDSRYMVSDTFVWWIEATVAVSLPLSFLAAELMISSQPLNDTNTYITLLRRPVRYWPLVPPHRRPGHKLALPKTPYPDPHLVRSFVWSHPILWHGPF